MKAAGITAMVIAIVVVCVLASQLGFNNNLRKKRSKDASPL